jgi:predicted secreted hydrolase
LAPLAIVLAVVGACFYYAWQQQTTTVARVAAPIAGPLAGGSNPPVERTAAMAPVSLPADDAAHLSAMEWWYYSGILDGPEGARYAFHMAVFVANGLVKQTVMHAAVTDLQSGKRYTAQLRTGGAPAASIANGFDFQHDGWLAAAAGGAHSLGATGEGFSLALDLEESGPPVLHRAAGSATPGLLDFGSSGISYYYSRPHMAAQGELSLDGIRVPVSGKVWFDHQWGDFDVLSLGWNWFALHLGDGSDLMIYALFDADGRQVMKAGTLANTDGAVALDPAAIEITPGKTWTSPKTGVEYVVEWTLRLPSGVLQVTPFFPDAEFDSSQTSANIYWEGPVRVAGSSTGEGFMELSGYDRLAASHPNPSNR